MIRKERTIGLVCSLGGHLEQMRKLQSVYEQYDRFLIIPNETSETFEPTPGEKVYTITDINEGRGKNPVLLLKALFETLAIFVREKPSAIISTGAGVAIPAFLLARLLGVKSIYIESFARIRKPSSAGRICYRLSDLFLVQHEELLEFYPKGKYYGPVYTCM